MRGVFAGHFCVAEEGRLGGAVDEQAPILTGRAGSGGGSCADCPLWASGPWRPRGRSAAEPNATELGSWRPIGPSSSWSEALRVVIPSLFACWDQPHLPPPPHLISFSTPLPLLHLAARTIGQAMASPGRRPG